MYRIALIQNKSEMLRYSWADTRPLLEDVGKRSVGYEFDGYTSENIDALFPLLEHRSYDAIVIASNACGDTALYEKLVENRQHIETHLESGGGLLVSFQMKLAESPSYEFLPEPYRVSVAARSPKEAREGCLDSGVGGLCHPIMCYPNKIDLARVQAHCLGNNLVPGIYWIYIKPENLDGYSVLVHDSASAEEKPLLVVSGTNLPGRVVVSALALDWQEHQGLWENTLRYVVEGWPLTAVISKQPVENASFDFRYLVATLANEHIPFGQYLPQFIDKVDAPRGIHQTYILDPAWAAQDVERFVQAIGEDIDNGRARVLSFAKVGGGRPTLMATSNTRDLFAAVPSALSWLVLQFPETGKGYWSNSFWATVDAIQTLVEFGQPTDAFSSRVVEEIAKHDVDGSYDEVLGASCAMLEIYTRLLGQKHRLTCRAEQWIRANMSDKTRFEQATAIDVLVRLHLRLDKSIIQDFVEYADSSWRDLENEYRIYRLARTLVEIGYPQLAKKALHKLSEKQDARSGKWLDIPTTAAIVELLGTVQATVGSDEIIDEMIFRGIQYLRSTYTPNLSSWQSDVTSTAKALRAIRAFEGAVAFPVDVTLAAIGAGAHRAQLQASSESAMLLSARLREQIADHRKRISELEGNLTLSEREGRWRANIAAACLLTLFIGVSLTAALIRYLNGRKLIVPAWTFFTGFLSASVWNWLVPTLIGVTILVVYTLQRLNRLPSVVRVLLAHWFTFEVES